ncbi:UNVERIFIED_CONTAM: hypothetical protein Slati_4123600 [Sesamum latifolium]|uniref:Uncharacterized protein n=1 Tax=Sesamum latifolium TaxID=2727402 RepID=A0AAW2T8Q6_9LAMI
MMKGKGVAIESYADQEEEGGLDYDHRNLEPRFALPFSTRNTSSRYDFVKVKVWLGESADHYYVLSRFLLSRMLTVTKIPNHVAIKIALELKKLLIDNSLLDVSQSDLEANLFKALLEEWLSSRSNEKYPIQDREKLIGNLKTIQDYLCSFKSQGYAVASVSATTFPKPWIGCIIIFFSALSRVHHLFPLGVMVKHWAVESGLIVVFFFFLTLAGPALEFFVGKKQGNGASTQVSFQI